MTYTRAYDFTNMIVGFVGSRPAIIVNLDVGLAKGIDCNSAQTSSHVSFAKYVCIWPGATFSIAVYLLFSFHSDGGSGKIYFSSVIFVI